MAAPTHGSVAFSRARARAVRMAAEGVKPKAIAARLGHKPDTVYYWLREANRPPGRCPRGDKAIFRDPRIPPLIAQGKTVAEVMAATGLKRSTVYKAILVAGLRQPGHRKSPKRDEAKKIRRETGATIQEIAHLIGRSYTRVQAYLCDR